MKDRIEITLLAESDGRWTATFKKGENIKTHSGIGFWELLHILEMAILAGATVSEEKSDA